MAKNQPLPERKCFASVGGLYEHGADLAASRLLIPVKVNTAREEHLDCHRRAAQRMRQELKTDSALAWRLALRRERERMQTLVKEQAALGARLEQLEEEAVLVRVRIAALHSAFRPEYDDR